MIIPYTVPRDTSIDYRFWNEFHSNYYLSMLFNAKNSKILKMKYVDWEHLESKRDRDFNQAIATCKKFGLYDLMAFKYDWNTEILLQFLATFYCCNRLDMLHWMTEGRHYKIDFKTFSRLLGLGAKDRGF